MSSLPQGWHHGLSETHRRSISGKSTEFVSCVPKLRWNSHPKPMSNTYVTPRKKTSSITMLPNSFQSKIKPPVRNNSAKASKSLPLKSDISLVNDKDLQMQIASIKKEVKVLKAENAVLRAHVRKLDDENKQLSRHVTKLKSDNQETGGTFRQKVSRLENSIKEKDQHIKKMVAEVNSLKYAELKTIMEKYQKLFGLKNGIGCNVFQRHKSLPSANTNSSLLSTGRPNVMNHAPSSDAERLKNILHKRDAETQSLQKQLKDKDLEIRQLKVQLSQRIDKSHITLAKTSLTSQIAVATSRTSISNRSSSTSLPFSSHSSRRKSSTNLEPAIPSRQSKVAVLPKVNRSQTEVGPNRIQFVPKAKPKPKSLCNTKCFSQQEIEEQVQRMRENIAARKIQQGWRHHRKMQMNKGASLYKNEALSFIFTELAANAKRKEKLNSYFGNSWRLSSSESEQSSNNIKAEFTNFVETSCDFSSIHTNFFE